MRFLILRLVALILIDDFHLMIRHELDRFRCNDFIGFKLARSPNLLLTSLQMSLDDACTNEMRRVKNSTSRRRSLLSLILFLLFFNCAYFCVERVIFLVFIFSRVREEVVAEAGTCSLPQPPHKIELEDSLAGNIALVFESIHNLLEVFIGELKEFLLL